MKTRSSSKLIAAPFFLLAIPLAIQAGPIERNTLEPREGTYVVAEQTHLLDIDPNTTRNKIQMIGNGFDGVLDSISVYGQYNRPYLQTAFFVWEFEKNLYQNDLMYFPLRSCESNTYAPEVPLDENGIPLPIEYVFPCRFEMSPEYYYAFGMVPDDRFGGVRWYGSLEDRYEGGEATSSVLRKAGTELADLYFRVHMRSACIDDIDNDGDGLVDYPDDPGCESVHDMDEFNPPEVDSLLATSSESEFEDGIRPNKGTANKDVFTFKVTYQGSASDPEIRLHYVKVGSSTYEEVQMHVDIGAADPLLRDGDFTNGEQFSATSTFPKGDYGYFFSASGGETIISLPEAGEQPLTFTAGFSNVAFLHGHQASRLYEERVGFDKVWLPDPASGDSDVETLFLNADGASESSTIYTKDEDIIEEGTIFNIDVYEGFPDMMNTMVEDDVIAAWKPIAYDWRLDYSDLFGAGVVLDDRIYYGRDTDSPYILEQIARLASSSDSGKVSLIGHSNGGLLLKKLVHDLESESHPYHYLYPYIDALMLIASPQLGTPKALLPLLHGAENDYGALGIEDYTTRAFASNMASAYHLLPSERYFDVVERSDASVVTFDTEALQTTIDFRERDDYTGDELDSVYNFKNSYGGKIDAYTKLEEYLLGLEGRGIPEVEDVVHPSVLSSSTWRNSETVHADIDNWTPKDLNGDGEVDIRVVQIAGWGAGTPKGVEYTTLPEREVCTDDLSYCPTLPELVTAPIPSLMGDETVMLASAAAMPVETYYFDLGTYNITPSAEKNDNVKVRKHSNIVAATPILSLIQTIVGGGGEIESPFLSQSVPEGGSFTFLEVHSPVDVHVRGAIDEHAGPVIHADTGVEYIESTVPNVTYYKVGHHTYVWITDHADVEVELVGTDNGTFTIGFSRFVDGEIIESEMMHDIPVTDVMIGAVSIATGNVSPLEIDFDGDTEVDIYLEPYQELTIHDYIAILEMVIDTSELENYQQMSLQNKLEHIKRVLDKPIMGTKHLPLMLISQIKEKVEWYLNKSRINEGVAEILLKSISNVRMQLI